jgi:hypothetical protein
LFKKYENARNFRTKKVPKPLLSLASFKTPAFYLKKKLAGKFSFPVHNQPTIRSKKYKIRILLPKPSQQQQPLTNLNRPPHSNSQNPFCNPSQKSHLLIHNKENISPNSNNSLQSHKSHQSFPLKRRKKSPQIGRNNPLYSRILQSVQIQKSQGKVVRIKIRKMKKGNLSLAA